MDFFLGPPLAIHATAIVLIHGYRGLDDGQRAVTRRFAQEGFVCFRRIFSTARPFTRSKSALCKKPPLDIPRAVEKIVDSVPYLRKLPWVGEEEGCGAWFLHGRRTCALCAAQSRAFAAGVIYYQSLFPDPEDLKGISAPLLCHYGTDDPGTTKTEIDDVSRNPRQVQEEI